MRKDPTQYIVAALRLKHRREFLGFTAAHVANRLGVDAPRYLHWEKVFGPLPQRQYGDALAQVLGVDKAWLVSADGDIILSEPQGAPEPFIEFGERARTRRKEIGLTLPTISHLSGIPPATLRTWEEKLPGQHRGLKEDQWEDALRVPRGWLRDRSKEALPLYHSSGTPVDLSPASPLNASDEISAIAAWLSRPLSRPRALRAADLDPGEQRRAEMFAARYGVLGPDKTILQAIGDDHGLTRERVRQLTTGMLDRGRGVAFVTPFLRRVQELAAAASTISVLEFERDHRELLGPALSIADADRFAREVLGFAVATATAPTLGLAGNGIGPMLTSAAGLEFVKVVRDCSRRMIRSCGAASVFYATGMVSGVMKRAVSTQEIRDALYAVDGMEWLTGDEDWYWFGPDTASNRALDVARKTLSVAGRRVDIEELQQAVCRNRRLVYEDDRSQPPALEAPRHVLRELYARVPWMSAVQHDDFVLTEDVDPKTVLGLSEFSVSEKIRELGGVASRGTLKKAFVDTGAFSGQTLQIVLANSPIVRTMGFGLYGLRGVPASEAAFCAALDATGSSALALGPAELDEDGWCEFELRVNTLLRRSGVVDFPTRIVKALRGMRRGSTLPATYQPEGGIELKAEGLVTGTFWVGRVPSSSCRVTGLTTLLRAEPTMQSLFNLQEADAEPASDSYLRIRIHPATRVAELLGPFPGPSPASLERSAQGDADALGHAR
jgi:transcriptional regulator with XRE-family HTH domain